MIQFSKNILEKFPSEEHLTLSVLAKWCSGTQLELIAWKPENIDTHCSIDSNFPETVTIWILKNFYNNVNGWMLTLANGKWIFTQKDNILTRCGCGKSFSFKSGNEAKDKITLLKAKLKQYKHK